MHSLLLHHWHCVDKASLWLLRTLLPCLPCCCLAVQPYSCGACPWLRMHTALCSEHAIHNSTRCSPKRNRVLSSALTHHTSTPVSFPLAVYWGCASFTQVPGWPVRQCHLHLTWNSGRTQCSQHGVPSTASYLRPGATATSPWFMAATTHGTNTAR